MKYILGLAVVLGVGLAGYWWLANDSVEPHESEVSLSENVLEKNTEASSVPGKLESNSKLSTYQNDQWGIKFEYPIDWKANENTFRAGSSLFNVVLLPNTGNYLPDPIMLSIAPGDWGQTLYERAPSKAGYEEVVVGGLSGVKYNSQDMSLPNKAYLVQTEAGFWVNLFGKDGYEEELDQVLKSLVITPVEFEVGE